VHDEIFRMQTSFVYLSSPSKLSLDGFAFQTWQPQKQISKLRHHNVNMVDYFGRIKEDDGSPLRYPCRACDEGRKAPVFQLLSKGIERAFWDALWPSLTRFSVSFLGPKWWMFYWTKMQIFSSCICPSSVPHESKHWTKLSMHRVPWIFILTLFWSLLINTTNRGNRAYWYMNNWILE
jgi:hypothetical protein